MGCCWWWLDGSSLVPKTDLPRSAFSYNACESPISVAICSLLWLCYSIEEGLCWSCSGGPTGDCTVATARPCCAGSLTRHWRDAVSGGWTGPAWCRRLIFRAVSSAAGAAGSSGSGSPRRLPSASVCSGRKAAGCCVLNCAVSGHLGVDGSSLAPRCTRAEDGSPSGVPNGGRWRSALGVSGVSAADPIALAPIATEPGVDRSTFTIVRAVPFASGAAESMGSGSLGDCSSASAGSGRATAGCWVALAKIATDLAWTGPPALLWKGPPLCGLIHFFED